MIGFRNFRGPSKPLVIALFCGASSPFLSAQDRSSEAEVREALGEVEATVDESSGENHDPPEIRLSEKHTLETPLNLRDTYERPFLLDLWRQTHIGGYTEFEFHSFENGILGVPEGFRMRRTNLFLFTELGDAIHFGSEIEFETEFEGGSPSSEIEVAVEMAFIDWTLANEFVFRGGVILPPLGRVNVNHDGPVRDITDRPLVSTFVIPTTLSDAGLGFHGEVALRESLVLGYEAYLVNGFNILNADGELDVPLTELELLLREDSDSLGGDDNDSVAATGRLSIRNDKSVEFGASWHVGDYDERADNALTLLAADISSNFGPISLEAEIASAKFERDAFARAAGVPDQFWGYYVQGGYRLDGKSLSPIAPVFFRGENSSLTLVARYDFVDLDGDRGGAIELGIACRPQPDTVFKLSYRISQLELGRTDVREREGFRDSGLIFSIASYF